MAANALLGDWDVARAQYDSGTRLFAPWPEGDEVMMHLEVGRNELERARAIPAAGPINAAMIANLDDPQAALRELRRLYADPVVAEPALNRRDIALWAGHFGDRGAGARRDALARDRGTARRRFISGCRSSRKCVGCRSSKRCCAISGSSRTGRSMAGRRSAGRSTATTFDCD